MTVIKGAVGLVCGLVALALFSIESLAADSGKEVVALQNVDKGLGESPITPATPMLSRASMMNVQYSYRQVRR